jgi:hypothetical protein
VGDVLYLFHASSWWWRRFSYSHACSRHLLGAPLWPWFGRCVVRAISMAYANACTALPFKHTPSSCRVLTFHAVADRQQCAACRLRRYRGSAAPSSAAGWSLVVSRTARCGLRRYSLVCVHSLHGCCLQFSLFVAASQSWRRPVNAFSVAAAHRWLYQRNAPLPLRRCGSGLLATAADLRTVARMAVTHCAAAHAAVATLPARGLHYMGRRRERCLRILSVQLTFGQEVPAERNVLCGRDVLFADSTCGRSPLVPRQRRVFTAALLRAP